MCSCIVCVAEATDGGVPYPTEVVVETEFPTFEVFKVQTTGGPIKVRAADFEDHVTFSAARPGGKTVRIVKPKPVESRQEAVAEAVNAALFARPVTKY